LKTALFIWFSRNVGYSLPENGILPCARIFAVCIISGTRRRPLLPCVARRTHGKAKTHGKPYSSPCAKGQHTANLALRRVPEPRTHGEVWKFTVCPRCRHTANRRRRRQLARTASSRFFSPCAYIYTRRKGSPCARLLTHGKQGLRRPCSCRRRFAIGEQKCHATLIISTYLVNQIESQYLIIRVIRGRRVFYIAIIYSKNSRMPYIWWRRE